MVNQHNDEGLDDASLFAGGYDDDDDGGYDDNDSDYEGEWDETAIQPLANYGSMSISASRGGGGAGNQSEFAYSAIIARETEVRFDAFIDFVRNCRPDEKMLRNIVAGLLDLAAEEWRSPACRRQLRFEIEDQKAAYWIGRLGKEHEQEKTVADGLLARWGTADLIMVDIRSRRLRHGLDSVDHERPRWYTAMKRKEIVEQEATHLDPAAHEYFLCRLEQYSIQREIAEDRAQGNPLIDHSNLLKKLHEGKANPAEIYSDSPWAMRKAIEVCLQNPGKENPYWGHLERMFGGVAAAGGGRRRTRNRNEETGEAAPSGPPIS